MSDAWGEPLLTAKSRFAAGFATVMSFAALALTVDIGISTLGWGDVVGLTAILGGAAGIAIATTRCRVMVFRDGVVAVNVWRRWQIPRGDIAKVACIDGIKIVLRSSRPVQLSAFPGSVSIILSGNRRGRRFAAKMTDALELAEADERTAVPTTSTLARVRLRLASAVVIVTAAGVAVGLATMLHAVT
jgi:hypothetical protein